MRGTISKHVKRKWIEAGCMLIMVLVLAAGMSVNVQAGFGDFNDYSGSDWDSSYGTTYSYDSDYDDIAFSGSAFYGTCIYRTFKIK